MEQVDQGKRVGSSTALFPEPKEMGEREWGREILLVHAEGKYTLKKLTINKGSRGGLQYHRLKDEAGYVASGRLLLRYESTNGTITERILGPGEWFHLPPGSVHQEEALTDVEILEVSTPYFNDRVRVEEEFGLEECAGGLPTTSMEEIMKL